MFDVDTREIKRLERDLKRTAKRAFPFATKATLNGLAFQTQREARRIIERKFVIRNKFTPRSVQVDKAMGLNVRRQQSVVGSIMPGMDTQEEGGTKTKRGSEGVAIPTSVSAGQGPGARPRTRLPRKPNQLKSIQLKRRARRGRSRKQRNMIAIQQTVRSGNKFVFLDLQRSKGIFRVVGGKRKPRIRMIHDISRQSVRIPKDPWLRPAVEIVERRTPEIYAEALRFQLKRNTSFR